MLHPAPPEGTEDLIGDAARGLRRCEQAVAGLLEGAGFEEVVLPALERLELVRALGEEPDGLLQAVDRTGSVLVVRADFTASVARLAATRLRGRSPLRLYYRGSVVRDHEPGRLSRRERFQLGCELIGDGSAEADAQIVALAVQAVRAAGAHGAAVSVGSAGYLAALLDEAGAAEELRPAIALAIDRKDQGELRGLCAPLAGRARDALVELAGRCDGDEALARALASAPSARARDALSRAREVVLRARQLDPGAPVEADLGEIRGPRYYTGLVFNVYAAGAARALGGGGRYDRLLARFGDDRPAVGFCLDLDELARAGEASGPSRKDGEAC